MKRKGITLIAGAAAVGCLFGAYVLLKSHNQAVQEQEEALENVPVLDFDTEDITALSFDVDGTTEEFVLDGDDWSLKTDETFPVSADSLESVLTDLAELSAVRTLTDVDDVSEYGFEEPQNTFVFSDAEGNETKVTLGATNEGTGDDYMMLNDDTTVIYTVSSSLRTSISSDLYDYAQSEELPTISSDEVQSITVEREDGGYRIWQEDGVWYTEELGSESVEAETEEPESESAEAETEELESEAVEVETEELESASAETEAEEQESESAEINEKAAAQEWIEADEDTIDSAVSTFVNILYYIDFLEHNCSDGSPYGLDENASKIVITYGDDEEVLAFLIGNTDESGSYYVQMEGSKEVHTMSSYTLSTLLDASAEDWVKAEEETELESETESASENEAESAAENESEME
jgi:hypothetical protein